MRYFRVVWLPKQESESDPAVLWFEVDNENWETRKVDEYGDGRLDYAPTEPQMGSTWLADKNESMSVEEMNASGEFDAAQISRDEFEVTWVKAVDRHERES